MTTSNDPLVKQLFGLEESRARSTYKLATKDAMFSVSNDNIRNVFTVYNGKPLTGNDSCYLLIPKDDVALNELRPDNLQWYELYAFFNMLNTQDLSMAVPFLEIRWHEYVEGDEARAKAEKTKLLRAEIDKSTGDVITDTSLYFAPQTYFRQSQNKFRPFLGIKSFDVEIQNPIGMIATKYATLRLTLFDTTRLSEAQKFIYPGTKSPTLEINYGWSHPHGSKTFNSEFINSLRDRSMWKVANYNISINQNNTADISLELYSLAAHKMVRARLIAEDDTEFNKANEAAQEKIMKNSSEIDGLLNKNGKLTSDSQKNIDKLTKANWSLEHPEETSTFGKSLKRVIEEKLGKIFYKNKETHIVRDFEKKMFGDDFSDFEFINNKNSQTYLGILLLYLFGSSISKVDNEYENVETQLIFYNFNKHAGNIANKNIASFIIDGNVKNNEYGRIVGFFDQVTKYTLTSKILNPPVIDLLNIINTDYIQNPINKNYGIPDIKTQTKRTGRTDKQGKLILDSSGRPETKTTIATDAKEELLRNKEKYGFILPSIKMSIVEGKDVDNSDKVIRRIFIYDEGEPSKETELVDLREKLEKKNSIEEKYAVIRSRIPFARMGTEKSILKSALFQTISDPMLQTTFMQRAEAVNDAENTVVKSTIPAQFLPVMAELETFGFPNVLFGAKLFLDMRTNTTVDNIYRIIGMKHHWSQQTISTKLSLVPDDAWLHIANVKEDKTNG